jgi:anthranilate/para-aminobenzoate synthase component II
MILVVDMNWKRDSLAYSEFVSPILTVVEPIEPCRVVHFSDVNPAELGAYSKIILSGTPLKDFEAQKHLEKFQWLKTCEKPVLGICAGMQVISLVFGVPLSGCMQVGMTEIITQKPNSLFEGTFQAYTLHSLSASPSEAFDTLATSARCIQAIKHKQKPLYGVLFHPEVRNQTILSAFTKLT